MQFSFDATKDRINRAKHGLSLGDAAQLDWNSMQVSPDRRRDYGEDRKRGLAMWGGRLHAVVFVLREGVYRIISLRKANRREVTQYEKN